LKIQFLGTAAAEGIPALFCECESCKAARALGGKNIRTRSSVLIDTKFMVDFPPDTFYHVITQNLDLSKVEHIFITHSHSDHFYPEDIMMRKEPYSHINSDKMTNVYGNSTVAQKFKAVDTEADIKKRLNFVEVQPYVSYKADDAQITPLLADHAQGETSLLYLFKRNNKCLLYGHDTGIFPEITWQFLKNQKIDAAILDCTFGARSSSHNHMGFPECLKIKERLLSQNSIYDKTVMVITHFSHNCNLLHDELEKMASAKGFITAFDGMTLEI
jgi:phosphoribosyl 1,2-cyclic phosphate phosphodiesterase